MYTLIYTQKLCNMLRSMLISVLQDFATYLGVLISIPKSGKLMSTHIHARKSATFLGVFTSIPKSGMQKMLKKAFKCLRYSKFKFWNSRCEKVPFCLSYNHSIYQENWGFIFYIIIKLYLFNISVNCKHETTRCAFMKVCCWPMLGLVCMAVRSAPPLKKSCWIHHWH